MNKQPATNQLLGRAALLIPLLVYLLLSVLYLLAVPTGESPDEPGHLQCIEQVSLLGRLPQIEPLPEGDVWWSRGKIISGRMCYHMPLYYLLAGGVQKVVATAVSEPIDYPFPPTNQNFGPNPAMFDHPTRPSFWAFSDPIHLLALRLLSILLGGVTVWASYAVARLLLPGRPVASLFAGLLTAVWPQFVYLSRSLNNDGLATALAVLVLVVLLRVNQPQRFGWGMLLAILAFFTKLSVGFTAVAVLLVWGLEYWQQPARRREYRRVLLVCLGLLLAAFLLLYFTPTLWQHFTQGSGDFASITDSAWTWAYWQDVLRLTASSGWVRFGWMNVAAPQWQATVWWILLLATAVIGLGSLWQMPQVENGRFRLVICTIWLVLITLSYLQINLNRLQPQFRFALAAVPVLTTLSAVGWGKLFGENGRKLYIIGIASFIASLVIYNVWVVYAVVHRAYPWW